MSSSSHAYSPSLSMRGGGVAYAAWTDLNNQVFGARWDPATRVWGTQQQLTSSGSHSLTSVVLNPANDAVVLSTDYGTQYDVRGYPVAVP